MTDGKKLYMIVSADEYELEKLYNSGFYEKDIVEVDCFGKVIK